MTLDNDTRGWIMTALSGLACFVGAGLICVDLVIRKIPGRKNFRIENSNGFLSASLSLSFGVMLYSALAKMLPSAKKSLQEGGLSSKAASFAQVGLFIAGAIGIQVLSQVMHHFLPHQVVDCDHTHDDEEEEDPGAEMNECPNDEEAQPMHNSKPPPLDISHPLTASRPPATTMPKVAINSEHQGPPQKPQWSRILSTSKILCDANGQCYGYTDPCGFDCFRSVQARSESSLSRPFLPRSASTTDMSRTIHEQTPLLQQTEYTNGHTSNPDTQRLSTRQSEHTGHDHDDDNDISKSHHHHVPTNAFLSIGLQTSLAIGLHKIPEGFITYATNHANPSLGVSVFLSLFIHNISEGFALALPLYLALHSRSKAMLWSALLGGISQPLGAGIAAAWFKIAGSTNMAPGEAVYGGMFAGVAGIMANVGLQLMGEAWALTHHKNMCILSAFVGMGILGLSSALTA